MSGSIDGTLRAYRRYLAIIGGIFVAVAMLCAIPVLKKSETTGALNNFALPLNGDPSWYRDYSAQEIQDLDIFYQNIGPSIGYARRADVILLGPSFVVHAFDPELLREFGDRHHLKIFNMGFFGVRSGEFSRRVIHDWDLHPKLWIISADDQIQHFFNSDPTWAIGSVPPQPIPTLRLSRMQGWIAVVRRNLRWRWEDYWAERRPATPANDIAVYRRYDDGGAYFGNPIDKADDNPVIKVRRDQECHTSAAVIAEGRRYLADIRGRAILTLVPHSAYCPQQAKELGEILGVETLLPPTADYSSSDGGGHLDHKGAVAFTRQFLTSLEKSETFRKTLAQ